MTNNKTIILAGGSGFLGRALASELVERGYDVVILTRSRRPLTDRGIVGAYWDGKSVDTWAEYLDGAVAVVNLTGKNVNCRYTSANRREIVESRTDSVRALGAALLQCEKPPKVWVQASSLAIYGDAGNRWCDETAQAGTGFPVETCLLWEEAFNSVSLPATRRVLLRISFGLAVGRGALRTLTALTRCFLGGTVGTGEQFISWIHISDLTRMFLWAIEKESVAGVYNATGPEPVTNADFMRELRRVLRRPWSPPVPAWLARIGAFLIGTEASLALTGRRGKPVRFSDAGFEFQYPELGPALDDLFGRQK